MILEKARNCLISIVNKGNSFVYSNDSLKVNMSNKFYKVAFTSSGIARIKTEVENLNYLKTSRLESLVPMFSFKSGILGCVLEIESLEKIETQNNAVSTIYQKFNGTSSKEKLSTSIIPFLKSQFENKDIHSILTKFENIISDVGMIHGDLHRANIMLSPKGNLKVIDLDLFHKRWDRKFDLINIFVSEPMLGGIGWEDSFMECWKHESEFSAIDSGWGDFSSLEKRAAFFIYYLKRSLDEKQVIDNKKLGEVISLLNLGDSNEK